MTRTEERFLKAYCCALRGTSVYAASEYLDDKRHEDKNGLKDSKNSGWLESITSLEWKQLFSLAERHLVFPMVLEAVYPGAGDPVSDTLVFRNALKKAEEQTCGQARMTAEFLKLYMFLMQRGLRPIVMKGIVCRRLYPNPEQRLSSDEDLLIPEDEFQKYHRAFMDYGLRLALPGADIEKDHEVSYCNSQVYIELHKKAFPPESKAYGDLNLFFVNVGERTIMETIYGVSLTSMCHTDHLFYLICHAYKHFLNCGIGIRLVSDIVLFSMNYNEQIDWGKVTENCKQIKAIDFTSALYCIGEKYLFPERFPDRLKDVWNTNNINEEALLDDILKGGIYGTSSEDRLHSANFTLHAAEDAKTGKETSVFLSALFPNVRFMKNRYPLVMKMPVLLPFAWIYRIFSYGKDSILHKHVGNEMTEAVRVGNERVALMKRYRMIEERKKEKNPIKRIYKWTHTSFLAPVLNPVFVVISMTEYCLLNLKWYIDGNRMPTKAEKAFVKDNVTFIVKSFERQHLVKGLCRNICRIYPGVPIIIADDSRGPLVIRQKNVEIIRLPFNSGLGAGLHAALNEVKTPYVVRLDDDELLTLRTNVHRELKFLIQHPELDLIGFGHTTAIRLHSPAFNFKEYYKTVMKDALLPLKVPHMTKIDENHIVLGKVANIYLARTEKLREVGFDPKIRVIDHHEFFWRASGVMTSAVALNTVVFHRHNPYERSYNAYRSDFAADLEYIGEKRKRMLQEAKKK